MHLRLLGGASLIGPEGPAAGRRAQRRRLALLALMAVSRKPISRERLMGLLWPESDTERARKILSESLYVLRKEIHENVFRVSGDELSLDPTHVTCDVVEFEAALDRSDVHAAADLYGGALLEGFFLEEAEDFERWVDGERDRLERRYRDALERLARDAATPRDAVGWWRRLADRDPYDARTARALIESLAGAGDRAGALRHARAYQLKLEQDLGAAPDGDIAVVEQRLRSGAGSPAADARTAAGTTSGPLTLTLASVPPRAAMPVDAPFQARSPMLAALASEYEIQRVLGKGSTARVFVARDIALDRSVTLKVLDAELASSPDDRIRFERAARAAANIDHLNVVPVHRFGVLGSGEPFMVMRYVRGRTLKQRITAEGPIGVAETRRILADVAAGLAAAHAAGVIHRDVRPDNILLDEVNDRALVADFGLAALTEAWAHARSPRVTQTGQRLGDPLYQSPEQAQGGPTTESTDVYGLAVVAIEMLTAATPIQLATQRTPPDFVAAEDPALAELLRRCLASDPEMRPGARAVAERLRDATSGRPPYDDAWSWVPPRLRAAWALLARRHVPQWVAAVAATGVVIIGLTADMDDEEWMPDAALEFVLSTVSAAVLAAGILAWFHGERGEQRVSLTEVALLLLVMAAWVAALTGIL